MNIAEYNAVVGSTAEEFAATDLEIGQLFPWQILKQNLMFELPVNSVPTLDDLGESPVKRMQGFLKTLQKEMEEGLEIMAVLCFREWMQRGASVDASAISGLLTKVGVTDEKAVARTTEMLTKFHESKDLVELDREALVMLADWLGDHGLELHEASGRWVDPEGRERQVPEGSELRGPRTSHLCHAVRYR
jgi:hypothetical protein